MIEYYLDPNTSWPANALTGSTVSRFVASGFPHFETQTRTLTRIHRQFSGGETSPLGFSSYSLANSFVRTAKSDLFGSFDRQDGFTIITPFSQTVFQITNNGVAGATFTNGDVNGFGGLRIFSSRTLASTYNNNYTSSGYGANRPFTSTITDQSTDPKFALSFASLVFVTGNGTVPTGTFQPNLGSFTLTYGQFYNKAFAVGVHKLKSFNGVQFINSSYRTGNNPATFGVPVNSFNSWDPWFAFGAYPTVSVAPRTSPYDNAGIYALSEGETFSVSPIQADIEANLLQTFLATPITYSVGGRTLQTVTPFIGGQVSARYAVFNSSMLNGSVIMSGASHPIFGLCDIEDPNGAYTAMAVRAGATNSSSNFPIGFASGSVVTVKQIDQNYPFSGGQDQSPYRISEFNLRSIFKDGYVVPTFRKYFVGTKPVLGSLVATESYQGTLSSVFTGIAGFITFQQSIGGTVHSLYAGLTTVNIQVSFSNAGGVQTSNGGGNTITTTFAQMRKETYSQITGIPTETESSGFTTGRITKTCNSFNGSQGAAQFNTPIRTVIGSFTVSVSTLEESNLSSSLAVTFPPQDALTANPCHANLHNITFQRGSAIDARTYNLESGNDPNDLFTYRKFRNIGTVSTSAYYGYARGYLEFNSTTLLRPLDFLSPTQGSTNWELVGKANLYFPNGLGYGDNRIADNFGQQ